MVGLLLIALLFFIFIVYGLLFYKVKGYLNKIIYLMLFTFIWAGDQIVAGIAMQYYCRMYSHVKIYEKPTEVKGFSDWMGVSGGLLQESSYIWIESPVMSNGLVAERFTKQADGQILKETNVKSISKYRIKYQEDKINLLIVSIKRRHWWLVDSHTAKTLAEYCSFSPVNYFLTYVPIVYTIFNSHGHCYFIPENKFVNTSELYKHFFEF